MTIHHSKLVRELVNRREGEEVVEVTDPRLMFTLLAGKVAEELAEFVADPCAEELADVYQALKQMMDIAGLDGFEVYKTRQDKLEKKGPYHHLIVKVAK